MYKLLLEPNYIRVSTGANAHQFSREVVLFEYEPCHEKSCPLHMRKQRHRSAAHQPHN